MENYQKGGYKSLDENDVGIKVAGLTDGKVPESQLPSLSSDSVLTNNFGIGKGDGSHVYISADVGASNLGLQRYNQSTLKWEYTNDGSSFSAFAEGAKVGTEAEKPSNPNEGTLYVNTTYDRYEVYLNEQWQYIESNLIPLVDEIKDQTEFNSKIDNQTINSTTNYELTNDFNFASGCSISGTDFKQLSGGNSVKTLTQTNYNGRITFAAGVDNIYINNIEIKQGSTISGTRVASGGGIFGNGSLGVNSNINIQLTSCYAYNGGGALNCDNSTIIATSCTALQGGGADLCDYSTIIATSCATLSFGGGAMRCDYSTITAISCDGGSFGGGANDCDNSTITATSCTVNNVGGGTNNCNHSIITVISCSAPFSAGGANGCDNCTFVGEWKGNKIGGSETNTGACWGLCASPIAGSGENALFTLQSDGTPVPETTPGTNSNYNPSTGKWDEGSTLPSTFPS